MIEVTLKDGSKRKLWCTFGDQQIDLDPFSPSGTPTCRPHGTCRLVIRLRDDSQARHRLKVCGRVPAFLV